MGYRVGIDVGGTFTKAAVIDAATQAVVARHGVLTTHTHANGVAAGVVEVFRQALAATGLAPHEVVFLAHSTTQATNALLEGDVPKVGVLGLAPARAATLARAQVAVAPIDLAAGRRLDTANAFLTTDQLTDADIRGAIAALQRQGAAVLVASAAFGVDETGHEERVRAMAAGVGLPVTCGHEVTRLYGLATRTRTAVVNASILPRMIATADLTEAGVRAAGIAAPVMVMRGDGGVMDICEMRRRPAVTMLSGPAASVAGVLMHLGVSDGIYFEVGGTSSNLAVIQGGRPALTYARIGGHPTYVASLDVRVLGVAGGSLVRATPGGLVDVGPRSAHIAGLPYAAFTDPAALAALQIELFAPHAGDPADYVALKTPSGRRYALTVTCAANALGRTDPSQHCHGSRDAARAGFAALGAFLGMTPDAAAEAVLTAASDRIVPVIEGLIAQRGLDLDQRVLLGVGGGAGALVPFTAARVGLRHEVCRNAEIISSIGAALAMVREVVERIVPHPTADDLRAIRREALEAAVRVGAERATVDVTVEIDRATQRVRATASGAVELRARGDAGVMVEGEARGIAARSLGVAFAAVTLAAATAMVRVYTTGDTVPGPLRVIDAEGRVRVQRSRGLVRAGTAAEAVALIDTLWREALGHGRDTAYAPGLVLIVDRHVIDFSGVDTAPQVIALAASELDGVAPTAPVAIIALPR
jgi:N-methylhydantoinase A/oxoprolinase/acetone carboxylase beta subunit